MAKRKGFTLIELLVVIAIIALLLSILTPALNTVKERARRVVCKSNMHQWALGIFAYTAANDNKLLETVGYPDPPTDPPNNRYPCEVLFEQPQPEDGQDGMIYAMAFVPYMEGFNEGRLTINDVINLTGANAPGAQNLLIRGAWTCPANRGDNIDFVIGTIRDRNYLRLEYSYYARVEKWPVNATDPQDLTADELSGKRVIMADQIYYYGPYMGIVLYNHGLKGYSWDGGIDDYAQLCDVEGPPKISGIHKLFGDGHVVWKDRKEFDIENMHLNDAPDGVGKNNPNPYVVGENYYVGNFY